MKERHHQKNKLYLLELMIEKLKKNNLLNKLFKGKNTLIQYSKLFLKRIISYLLFSLKLKNLKKNSLFIFLNIFKFYNIDFICFFTN